MTFVDLGSQLSGTKGVMIQHAQISLETFSNLSCVCIAFSTQDIGKKSFEERKVTKANRVFTGFFLSQTRPESFFEPLAF